MSKKAVVLLAEGFEEVEAATPIDYLRRAGVEVSVAATGENLAVTGARGITLQADSTLAGLAGQGKLDASCWDAVVIPGGIPGAPNLAASKETGAFIAEMAGAGKLVCAICASPVVVLAPLGLISGKNFTCYPGMEKNISGGKWSQQPAVIDGNIITSRGPGTSGNFAIAIIEKLLGEAEAKKIAQAVLLQEA